MDQSKIGSFLKELRKEKGLTQEQAAEKLKVNSRTISRWETGYNLPDISMLVELSDFYGVDIREIIDGERKSENMTEETREVLGKVSQYVDEDKQKHAKWVRNTSIAGLICLLFAMGVQSMMFFHGGSVPSLIGILMTFVAFVLLLIVALYANGITKKSRVVKIIRIVLLALGGIVCSYLILFFVVTGIVMLSLAEPGKNFSGIEDYNKVAIVEEYGSDMDCGLYLFPDSAEKMSNVSFKGNLDTMLFDTDGYLILIGSYSEEDYLSEITRMSEVTCDIKDVTLAVKYDTNSYSLPAYIASDGYDSSYEYALLDESTHTITYVFLSYPTTVGITDYSKYLKKDKTSYLKDDLTNFTIYAYTFDNGTSYLEFTDNF